MFGQTCKIWNNARVFIIGGGPSLKGFDFEVLRGRKVLVLNSAWKFVPWAQVLYFMDCIWYRSNKDAIKSFKGLKFTTCNTIGDGDKGVIVLKHGHRRKLDERPDHLPRGSNSGVGGCYLAKRLGGVELILLGFDMDVGESGEHNFHNEYEGMRDTPISPQHYKTTYPNSFAYEKPFLEAGDVKIINCTLNSKLTCFPIEPLENWL